MTRLGQLDLKNILDEEDEFDEMHASTSASSASRLDDVGGRSPSASVLVPSSPSQRRPGSFTSALPHPVVERTPPVEMTQMKKMSAQLCSEASRQKVGSPTVLAV